MRTFSEALDRLGNVVGHWRRGKGRPSRRFPKTSFGRRLHGLELLEERALLSIGDLGGIGNPSPWPATIGSAWPEGRTLLTWADFRQEPVLVGPRLPAASPESLLTAESFSLTYTDGGIVGRIFPGSVLLETVAADDSEFVRLEIPGWSPAGRPGQAELPVLRTSVIIPDGVEVSADYSIVAMATLGSGHLVYPVQTPAAEPIATGDDPIVAGFDYDEAYYAGIGVPETPILTVGEPAIARGTRVVLVEISPFEYDPGTGEITVITDLTFSLDFVEADGPEDAPQAGPQPAGTSPAGLPAAAIGADYLIITADRFYDEVAPLAQWKQLKGLRTYTARMSEVGTTADDVRDFIYDAYHTGTQTSYVLLVGDYDDVPTNYSGYYASDQPYTTVDGTDDLADVALGRLPVHTEAETSTVVQKILRYDRTPDMGPWYDDVLIAGYFQDNEPDGADGYADRWFMETAMHVHDYLRGGQGMSMHTALTADTDGGPPYYYRNATYPHRISVSGPAPYQVPQEVVDLWTSQEQATADISAAINGGVGFVQHRDHGSATGWGHPPFHNQDVAELSNGVKTPVVFSTNCSTGTFDYPGGDSFVEALLKHPAGGAVGVLGATRTSYSGYNDLLTHGTFASFWPDYDPTHLDNPYPHSFRLGEALNFAKYYMYSCEGPGGTTEIELNEFHWFGDPEMMLRTATPVVLSVDHPATIPLAQSTDVVIEVAAGGSEVVGAVVCISTEESDDYWVGLTDVAGRATFTDLTAGRLGDYHIVVTAHNAAPYEGTIESLTDGPFGVLRNPALGSATNADLGFVDVEWLDDFGAGLDLTTIDSADVSVSGATVTDPIPLDGHVWRYPYIGGLSPGRVDVVIHADEVKDVEGHGNVGRVLGFVYDVEGPGAALMNPTAGSELYRDPSYIDVFYADVGLAGLDTSTLDAADVAIAGVTISGDPEPLPHGGYRYRYTGTLASGVVAVQFVPGEVADLAGNAAAGHAEQFTFSPLEIVTPGTLPPAPLAESYQVTLEARGGIAPYEWSLPMPVVITECVLGGPDAIEIQNTSDQTIDTSGWVVVVSDDYTNINEANPTAWSLPASMAPGEILYRTDDNLDQYWGGNILWNSGNRGWAMIVDDVGKVVDFVAWQWPAAAIAAMNVSIGGHRVTIGDEFFGDGVAVSGSETIQRIGNEDRNLAGDFTGVSVPDMGVQNAGLTVPFVGGASLPEGLVLDPTTGVIGGSAVGLGTFEFILTVTDSGSPAHTAAREFQLEITALKPLLVDVPSEAPEGAGVVEGTLTLFSPPEEDLIVELLSGHPAEVTVPPTAVIPAGETTVTFPITIADDAELDPFRRVTITASAPGYTPASDTIVVADDESTTLVLELPGSASEGDGVLSARGTVTAGAVPASDVVVELGSSDPAELVVPATVTIPAGQTSAVFDLIVVDDAKIDGTQTATVTARVANWTDGVGTVDVLDNEDLDLTVTLPPDAWENRGVWPDGGSVSISGTLTTDLVVSLACDDTGELLVPPTVTILSGETSAEFDLTVVNDTDCDGAQTASVTGDAAGFIGSGATMEIRDDDLHHFTLEPIDSPQTSVQPFGVTIRPRDVNGAVIDVYDGLPNLTGAGTQGAAVVHPAVVGGFVDGCWTGSVTVDAADTDVVLTVDDGAGHVGTSNPFDVLPGATEHFAFEVIESPQYVNTPIDVTLTARDAGGHVVSTFNGAVNLSGCLGDPTAATIVISEVNPHDEDSAEFTNVSGVAVDISGWRMVLYDTDTWPEPKWTVAVPEGTVCPPGGIFTVHEAGTAPGSYPLFSTGGNIFWTVASETAVLLLDAAGEPVDFMCAQWAYAGQITNPTPIGPEHWQGDPVPASQTVETYRRTGNQDHDSATDWAHAASTIGTLNPGLTIPFAGTARPVAITPTITANFIDGVWSGAVTVLEEAIGMYLRAEDGAARAAVSNSFDVEWLRILSIDAPTDATEGDGLLTAMVSIPFPLDSALTVELVSDRATEASVPATVVIPAGQTSARFSIAIVDDSELDWRDDATIRASAAGFLDASHTIVVHDNETAVLTVQLPSGITEGDGLLAGVGTVNVSQPPVADVLVALHSGDTSELTVPATVTIPAGQLGVPFDLTVVDDTDADGPQTVAITAAVENWTGGQAVIEVADNESFDLVVTLPADVWESAGVLTGAGTVSINGVLPTDLIVSLISEDTSELQVEPTVTIPAGQSSAKFDLTVLDDGDFDGVQRAVVVAGAVGTNDGSGAMDVRDDDVHHFAFDPIDGTRVIGEPFSVSVRAKDVRGETIEVFAGPVNLGGRTAGSTGSTIVISEVNTESPDRMEFTNVSAAAVDISGWQVFVYDRVYPTSPRPAFVFPPGTICPAGGVFMLQQNGTAPGTYPTFYTGDDISWRPYAPTGVLLLDDVGAVVDFVAASELDPAGITDPVTLVPDFWQGPAVPAQPDYSVTYQRVGGIDTDGRGDWILRGSSAGTLNPGMTLPFADQPISVPVTPLTAVEMLGGVWRGEMTVEALSTGVMLTAAAGRGLSGTSNAFDVEPGPVDRFRFNSIAPPQYADRPIDVTLTALDAYGNTAVGFNDTVNLTGWTAAGASTIVITECGLDGPDYIEIQNVSEREINTSGWIVALSDDYDDIDVANALTWSLPSSIPAGEVLHRTDDEGPNYWQGNIHWGAGNPGWAVILDDAGQIVDFVAWGWTASDLAGMNAMIDGHNFTPGDGFTGDGVPLTGTDSIQRQGNEDRNSAADFSWDPPESMGVQNPGLSVPFPGESTPVAVTPAVTASFIDGVWTGEVYVGDVLDNIYVQADDGNGHAGSSTTFDTLRFFGEIHGSKFLDRDGDGVWDVDEEGLEAWQIYLDNNLNGRWDAGEPTTLTDADGRYSFTGLMAGTYTVAEVARDDWVQTYPRDMPLGAQAAEPHVEITTTTTASDAPVYVASQPIPADGDSDLLPETNVSGSLVGIDRFRADPRFAGIDGSGFATVILDTGIAVDHPFFGPDQDGDGVADRIVYQWDYADDDGDAGDTKWAHGSTVTSIAASGDATYTGMAPGADIIFFKIFPDSGDSSFAYVESALQWVIDHAVEYNIVSVNMSFTDGENYSAFVDPYGVGDEMAQLAAMNVIVVSAAGNSFYTHDSVQGESYPAADANSLSIGGVYVSDYGRRSYGSGAVANTTAADRIAPYSQRHETMTTVFAPSGKVTGAGKDPPGKATLDGTSAAAPHVAGIAALAQQLAMRELGRCLTTAEVISLLRQTGATIHDGDDEDDNVANTDADFPRVDAFALGEEILRLGALSRAHTIVLAQGEVVEDVDFGNRPETKIADRHVFYNHSAFDGNDDEANAADDDAIAVDKEALLPGEGATFAHYTSFSRGINGVMVDLFHATRIPTAADFLFRVGNNNDPATWTPPAAPASVIVRAGAGTGGSDRATIIFEDAAIKNQWLEVTVLAEDLGLDHNDVFYFGNAVGESGNSPTNAQVTVIDMLLARNNPRSLINPAAVDFGCDYNRDARVNATDVLLARNNPTGFQSTLKLINLSGQGYGGPAQAAEGPSAEASAAASEPAGWPEDDSIESDDTPAGRAWLREIEPPMAKGREARESTAAKRTSAKTQLQSPLSLWETGRG